MKKIAIMMIAILLITMCFGLTACQMSGELPVPENVSINGNTLSWDAVKNASGYIVMVDGKETFETTNTFYTYTTEVKGKHTMQVKAKGVDKFKDSKYSEVFIFNVTTDLSAPRLDYKIDGDNVVLSWSEVPNATGYELMIGLNLNEVEPISVAGTTYTVNRKDDAFDDTGEYFIKVRAITTDENYNSSSYSNLVSYINTEILPTPQDFKYENSSFKWTCDNENVNRYRVKAVSTTDESVVFTYETSSKSMSYSSLKIDKAGEYKVTVTSFNSNSDKIYKESAPSEALTITVLGEVDASTFRLDDNGVLYWDKVDGAVGYTIDATTLQGNSFSIDIDSVDTVQYDMTKDAKFKEEERACKVYTFTIRAKGDESKLIFQSNKTELTGGKYYQYIPSEGDYTDATLRDKVIPKLVTAEENGVSVKYYDVTNYPQLMWALAHADSSIEIRLTKNIEITSTEFISPVTTFNGKFNGMGHTISGIEMSSSFARKNMSIFGTVAKDAYVKNLIVSGIDIDIKDIEKGGLIANVNNGTIENVVVEGVMVINNNGSGSPIVYENNGTIDSAISKVKLQATSAAGIAVINNGNIKNCEVFEKIDGVGSSIVAEGVFTVDKAVVGGIAAENNGTISYSFVNSSLMVNTAGDKVLYGAVGGIAGINGEKGIIEYSYVMSGVTSNCMNSGVKAYAGGFVGENRGEIRYSYVDSTSSVKRQDTTPLAAGFAGLNSGTIRNVFSSISVPDSSNKNKAGFVADNTNGKIIDSAYHLGKANNAAITLSGKEGTVTNSKGYVSNEMANSVEILGEEFVVNKAYNSSMPVLKKVIYVDNYTIASKGRDIDLISDDADFAKYFFNGEEKRVEGELRTNNFSGYQIVKYTDVIDGITVVYNRLIQVR